MRPLQAVSGCAPVLSERVLQARRRVSSACRRTVNRQGQPLHLPPGSPSRSVRTSHTRSDMNHPLRRPRRESFLECHEPPRTQTTCSLHRSRPLHASRIAGGGSSRSSRAPPTCTRHRAGVGGTRITATHIGEGYQDPHFIEAKPSFVLQLRHADVWAFVGLDLEVGWMPLLLHGARNPKIKRRRLRPRRCLAGDPGARHAARQRRPQPGRCAPARQSALLARPRERPPHCAALPRQFTQLDPPAPRRTRRTRAPSRHASIAAERAGRTQLADDPRQAGRCVAHELALLRRLHGDEHRRVHGAEARRSTVARRTSPG